MEYVLRTFSLTKKYKSHFAVNGADMTVCKGDIYGFVGENGSGKTTIIRLITGLIFPQSGSFELFGISNESPEIHNARKKIGAIVESPSIYGNMSAYDNLKMQCTILGIEDNGIIMDTLTRVGLGELYNNKKHAGDFSLGMRQRLGIAMALLGDPEFIILDEPMNGLDPAGIVEIRELILKLNREEGITFLISSHILTELSLVANKYGIISKGKIIKEISASELHNQCGKYTVIKSESNDELFKILNSLLPNQTISALGDGAKIFGDINLNEILSELIKNNIQLLSVNCDESSLEDYYLSIVGGENNG